MLSDLYYMQENTLTEESVEFTGTLIKPPVAQQFSFMGNTTNFLHIHKKKKGKTPPCGSISWEQIVVYLQ